MSGVESVARHLGGLAWVSGKLFAIEGRWAAAMDDPRAVEHLATHSRHHGWHATLWTDALPDSPALDAGQYHKAPSAGWEEAVAWIDNGASASDVRKLAALYRCLVPRHLVLVDAFVDQLGGPGDAAVERTAAMARRDVAADLHGGLRLLTATLRGNDVIEIAGSVTKKLDQAFRT